MGGDASGVALEGVNGANGDVNFAWPGREADDPGAGDDLDSARMSSMRMTSLRINTRVVGRGQTRRVV